MITVEKIMDTLSLQVHCYRDLMEVLQQEKDHLLDFDVEGLETVSKEKDTTVMRLRLMEEARVRQLEEYFRSTGSQGKSLMDLYETVGDESIMNIRTKLISQIKGVKELNDFNNILIGRSLNYVRASTDFFSAFGHERGDDVRGVFCSWRT